MPSFRRVDEDAWGNIGLPVYLLEHPPRILFWRTRNRKANESFWFWNPGAEMLFGRVAFIDEIPISHFLAFFITGNSLHFVGATMILPVELVEIDTVLVGLLAISMADFPRSPTTPASVAMLCWSGVALEVDKTMPLVLENVPSVIDSRNDLTVMVSVVRIPFTVVVRVAVTATHPHKADPIRTRPMRETETRLILNGVAGFGETPSRSR